MRVLLFTDYSTLNQRAKRAGDVADIPDADAERLVSRGLAQPMPVAPRSAQTAVRADRPERATRRVAGGR